jgi:soluble lytic murein transglycosylase-like protein
VGESSAAARRKAKAIRDFQAVFLMEMMKPLTRGLSGASSEDAAEAGFGLSSGADVYSYFWGEALAQHLAGALPGLPGLTAVGGDGSAATSAAPNGGAPLNGGTASRAGQSAVVGSASRQAAIGVSAEELRSAENPVTGFALLAADATLDGVAALAAASPKGARRAASAAPADATVVASPSAATRAPYRSVSGLSEEVHALAGKAGRLFSLPENLVRAIVTVESGGRANAVSNQGAIGLMQLMPGTAREMGVKDPRDAWDNLVGGAKYFARQLERFGRLDQALAAYNAGPAAVERHAGVPPFPETRDYVRRVLLAKSRLDRTNPVGA